MSDKSSNWVTSTDISKLKNYSQLVSIFQSNIEKDSYPKDIGTDSYKNIIYHLTNLPLTLKLLSLYFVFGCLVADQMNQKDKKSQNQDLSNLALGYCITAFHKNCLFLLFHFSHS